MTGSAPPTSTPTRCPLCQARLEATRSRRFTTAGGRWLEGSKDHWVVRCLNSHTGDGETLPAAVDAIGRRR